MNQLELSLEDADHFDVASIRDSKRLDNFVSAIRFGSDEKKLVALRSLRNLLSNEKVGPHAVQPVVDTGVVPDLISMLRMGESADMQFEAAWGLTNIAGHENEIFTNYLIDLGLGPLIVQKVAGPDMRLAEQCVWCLGNLAGDSVAVRDQLLALNAPSAIATLVANTDPNRIFVLRHAAWTINNLLRGKPTPSVKYFIAILPVLPQLLAVPDDQVLQPLASMMSSVSNNPDSFPFLLEHGVLSEILRLLQHPAASIAIPTLRVVENLSSGNEQQQQTLITESVLAELLTLMTHYVGRDDRIVSAVFRTMANLCAGSPSQLQEVLASGLFVKTLKLLTDAKLGASQRRDAFFALTNAAITAHKEQLRFMIRINVVPIVANEIAIRPNLPVEEMAVLLRALLCFLKHEELAPSVTDILVHDRFMPSLEQLQKHPDDTVFGYAVQVLELCDCQPTD